MNWKFWKKEVEDGVVLPKDGQGKTKMIDGHVLTIHGRNVTHQYRNPDLKQLWKIYSWYLTKDSEKYNIKFNGGMRVLNRFDVKSMELHHTKIIDEWSKDDETQT